MHLWLFPPRNFVQIWPLPLKGKTPGYHRPMPTALPMVQGNVRSCRGVGLHDPMGYGGEGDILLLKDEGAWCSMGISAALGHPGGISGGS